MPVRVLGFPVSTWTRTACMVCVEKGIDYELAPVAYGSEGHAELHPFKRIPVLEHDRTVVTESLAICCYLDEAFEGPALQPDALAGRVAMWEWMSLCGDYVYRDVVRAIPRDRPPSAQELGTASVVLERVEARIGAGPFLIGAQLTLADLYLAPQVGNAREKAPEVLEPLPRLRGWLAGIESRASFAETGYDAASLARLRR